MPFYQKLIAACVALGILFAAGEFHGAGRVQAEWDKDKAVNKALIQAAEQRAQDVAVAMADQWNKEIDYAKTEAARRAAADYLRKRGMLPTCIAVRDPGSEATSEGAGLPDGASEEQSARRNLEGFTLDCGEDANKVTDWQELCRVQRCEIIK